MRGPELEPPPYEFYDDLLDSWIAIAITRLHMLMRDSQGDWLDMDITYSDEVEDYLSVLPMATVKRQIRRRKLLEL